VHDRRAAVRAFLGIPTPRSDRRRSQKMKTDPHGVRRERGALGRDAILPPRAFRGGEARQGSVTGAA
jgi:hypothetical protein